MFGIIVSFFMALGVWFFPGLMILEPVVLEVATIAIALIFLSLYGFTMLFAFTPMQKVEQELTPRLFELFQDDRQFRLIWAWMVIFNLLTVFLVSLRFTLGILDPYILVMVWVIALGITFDLFRHYVLRIMGYMNPYVIIKMLRNRAKVAIQAEDESDLCNYIDALSEVGMKTLNRSGTALCQNAIEELQVVTKLYLESEKIIGHQDSKRVPFVLFYIFERLEMIHTRAIKQHLEPISSALVTAMGRIAIQAAKYDISLASYPLHFLGKFALRAQNEGLEEVGERASLVLVEVAKGILEGVSIEYVELKEAFFALTGQLESLTKEMFRRDKSISFAILEQPFIQIKELFQNEPVSSHQDAAAIVGDIDRVLDEFANLQMVMKTVPPVRQKEPAKEV